MLKKTTCIINHIQMLLRLIDIEKSKKSQENLLFWRKCEWKYAPRFFKNLKHPVKKRKNQKNTIVQ